ncbi:MAG: pyridoxal 5'-phosphate synthase glutaminase subunit PdxT [Caldithrix sp.]|nr:pyridoxal 5'-phosphate synthase glutaminase subunit PdxT [Caldithrix sp.]
MAKRVGILALQGDFTKHVQSVARLNHQPVLIRKPEELKQCDYLILPGGESTTFLHLIEQLDLRQPIIEFSREKPIMGTCAGLITLSKDVAGLPHPSLGLIDLHTVRNAYGRQIDSFVGDVRLSFDERRNIFEGIFIRAPRIKRIGQDVEQIGFHNDDVVLAHNQTILVASFHPELTDDTRIHRYFLDTMGK